jgi:cytoskeletal protein CcmA (bactofilin family)
MLMWKPREDEARSVPLPTAEVARIGKSVVVKGELSGSEDLYVDGEVEGNIELHGHSLIIGPTGRVRAKVDARQVVVHGELHGNVRGTERVELRKAAVLVGDVVTHRIMIEDGAHFKGSIDIQRQAAKPETRHGSDPGSSAESIPEPSMAGASSGEDFTQPPLLGQKKF